MLSLRSWAYFIASLLLHLAIIILFLAAVSKPLFLSLKVAASFCLLLVMSCGLLRRVVLGLRGRLSYIIGTLLAGYILAILVACFDWATSNPETQAGLTPGSLLSYIASFPSIEIMTLFGALPLFVLAVSLAGDAFGWFLSRSSGTVT